MYHTQGNGAVEHEHVSKLIESIFTVHNDEAMDCEGCGCQLDHLAELVAGGADLRELLPAVEAHLHCCRDCREEFEALVCIIRASNKGALAAQEQLQS
jgi:hypothetical protein